MALPRILLLGKDGQVGWELQRSLQPLGEVVAWGRAEADLEATSGLRDRVLSARPDVVVNAAAWTAVDRAESEATRAEAVNAIAPGEIAAACDALGAWLVHYSTDYVFAGTGTTPHREDDPTGPTSVYGRTKLAGEHAIRERCARHLVFRTSWVHAARGGNFAKTMLRLAAERDALSVVADQTGAPTGADLIADVTAHALRAARADASLAGTYHLAAAGETTWCDYARLVVAEARAGGMALRVAPEAIVGVDSSAYPTPARRPANSRLDTARLRTRFGLALPPWETGVRRLVAELLAR